MPPFQAPYLALNAFVAPARPKPELWRTLCGLLIAALFGFLTAQAILFSLVAAFGPQGARRAVFEIATGASPGAVIALLFCYLAVTAGLALGLALMMRRGLPSLIGPPGPALGSFLRVALPLTGLWLLPWLPLALFGLAAADLTARTGNLGAAVGLHFANNASAVLMVGIKGNLGGLALYNATVDPADLAGALSYLAFDTLALLIGWVAARLILRV